MDSSDWVAIGVIAFCIVVGIVCYVLIQRATAATRTATQSSQQLLKSERVMLFEIRLCHFVTPPGWQWRVFDANASDLQVEGGLVPFAQGMQGGRGDALEVATRAIEAWQQQHEDWTVGVIVKTVDQEGTVLATE